MCVVIAVWLSVFSFVAIEAAGEIVLTVEGPGDAEPITFTEFRIRVLPQTSFSTYDPWDRKRRQYTGVKLLKLLEDIGRLKKVAVVEIISRNNYRANMELTDVRGYEHLLSYEMDGNDYADLQDGNKGPLAIAVKMDDIGEGERLRIQDQFVWWIERIILR